jgi:Ca2+:H+ antiporter
VARGLLWASLALAPITLLLDVVASPGQVALFVLAAISLVPLAWLIGESTEHAGEHTGPGIGGFLNATFGNAPELIIALIAIADALPNVVRGSIAGSVVSNILLVLGVALIAGGEARLDRNSLLFQLSLVAAAVALFLLPSFPGFHGDPERHALALLTIPVAAVLLVAYVAYTWWSLRRHHQQHAQSGAAAEAGSWNLWVALAVLAVATTVTALVSEVLVHSLDAFADAAGLSEFFIAVVIVAIVGNAAEHGGAVVIARRGKMRLATEIAVSSSAQVALFVAPAVALTSFAFEHPLTLAFRWEELVTMGGAAVAVAIVIRDGRSRRWEGFLLVGVYVAVVVWFLFAGDRGA